jgi:hypothetical protein
MEPGKADQVPPQKQETPLLDLDFAHWRGTLRIGARCSDFPYIVLSKRWMIERSFGSG